MRRWTASPPSPPCSTPPPSDISTDWAWLPAGVAGKWARAGRRVCSTSPPWGGEPAAPNVDALEHDVASDPPPEGPFDLVHARLVLVHVHVPDTALANMVSALRPGGVLLVEDADPALQPLSCLEELGPAEVLANRLRRGFRSLLAERGVDLAYGRSLPRRLRGAGLVQVAADAAFPLSNPACNHLEAATINLISDQLLDHGIATEDDIARHLANVRSGLLDLAQPPMISCWGRRPPPD